ncbi:hypothetical protein CAC42_4739 [Sphaceloma murrayae]|uniref:Uncharacterized protein n=1 Tax=Sphaceloma murrayae TaxID=2082308 RepID=A0A2K1QNT5_9PEZI|nr:hypothetical protein CAC42_4739 [Sphaceloma murrayae]
MTRFTFAAFTCLLLISRTSLAQSGLGGAGDNAIATAQTPASTVPSTVLTVRVSASEAITSATFNPDDATSSTSTRTTTNTRILPRPFIPRTDTIFNTPNFPEPTDSQPTGEQRPGTQPSQNPEPNPSAPAGYDGEGPPPPPAPADPSLIYAPQPTPVGSMNNAPTPIKGNQGAPPGPGPDDTDAPTATSFALTTDSAGASVAVTGESTIPLATYPVIQSSDQPLPTPTLSPSAGPPLPDGTILDSPPHNTPVGGAASIAIAPGVTVSADPARGGAYVLDGTPLAIGRTITRGAGASATRVAVQTPEEGGGKIRIVVQGPSSTLTTGLVTGSGPGGSSVVKESSRPAETTGMVGGGRTVTASFGVAFGTSGIATATGSRSGILTGRASGTVTGARPSISQGGVAGGMGRKPLREVSVLCMIAFVGVGMVVVL